MNTLIAIAEACEGYACPPGNKVPSSEVIVERFVEPLATTGIDPSAVGLLCVLGMLLIGLGILGFAGRRKRY